MKKLILLAAVLFLPGLLQAKVLLGIDVLEKQNFQILRGKRLGLMTNHTEVNSDGKSTIDLLLAAKDVKLVALFCPEHGALKLPCLVLQRLQRRLTFEMSALACQIVRSG